MAARHAGGGSYVYVDDTNRNQAESEIAKFEWQPTISIVMPVHDVAPRWLNRAVESVKQQMYTNWELCIADDCSTNASTLDALARLQHDRITVRRLSVNKGISGASNEALDMASGTYIALLDHDDELTPDALYQVVSVINAENPDLIYSDEDLISPSGRYIAPHFKPDFSPDLLLEHNYMTHLLVANRDLVDRVGGFREAYDGAQDYDLILRLTEQASRICHIRKVLYHWRSIESSTSRRAATKPYTLEAGRRAIEDAFERRGIQGTVRHSNMPNFYQHDRTVTGNPLVSIVIPFRDRVELLETCVRAIVEKSTYSNFEVLAVDNGSANQSTLDALQRLEGLDSRLRFVRDDGDFNFSRIANHATGQAMGEHLVLMNNDVEVISEDWIQELLQHSQRPEVGAVGGKLYYRNGRVQHAGIVLGIHGFAGHSHHHLPGTIDGYMNRLRVVQNVSAVTAALLMVKKLAFEDAGGLDEEHLGTALSDVDFCLRLLERGLLNVFTPRCEAYHDESASRGHEVTPGKRARFEHEIEWFKERHRDFLAKGDPYYNRNLTLATEKFSYVAGEPPHGGLVGTVDTQNQRRLR